MSAVAKRWPGTGVTEIPFWVYTDKDVYESELDRIWYADHWLYAGLEAEVPDVGSYRTTTLAERQVIVVRSSQDQIRVLVFWLHAAGGQRVGQIEMIRVYFM